MEKHGFTIEDICEDGEYIIQRVEGGMPYMVDTRGLIGLTFLFHTHYKLLSPPDYPLLQEFILGTNEAYKLFERGQDNQGADDLSALAHYEDSYKIITSLIRQDRKLSALLRLEDSLILTEAKLLTGYFIVTQSSDDEDLRIIQRMSELAEEENFYHKAINNELEINQWKKSEVFSETTRRLSLTGGMRVLVE